MNAPGSLADRGARLLAASIDELILLGAFLPMLFGAVPAISAAIAAGVEGNLVDSDTLVSNVETYAWTNVHYIGILMCLLGMVGVAGIYLRQVRESGLLGLAGCVMLVSFFFLTAGFQFIEALALPEMTDDAPQLVTHILGISTGKDTGDLGAITAIWPITGALYLVGGLVFSVALYRARVLARWASIMLAAGVVVTLAIPAVPHSTARLFAFPVGALPAQLAAPCGKRPAAGKRFAR